ncbi:MAG: F0F1 ATP synthase subunit alpha, partial [Patescibacteria group bacterium]
EIFKQGQYMPVSIAHQILIFFAITTGLLDNIQPDKITEFELGLYKYANTSAPDILKEIIEKRDLNDELESKMKKLIEDYKSTLEYIK